MRNPKKRKPLEHEVKYWKFGVTRKHLQQVVQAADPLADAVERLGLLAAYARRRNLAGLS
jgi:hypothetical protein